MRERERVRERERERERVEVREGVRGDRRQSHGRRKGVHDEKRERERERERERGRGVVAFPVLCSSWALPAVARVPLSLLRRKGRDFT